MAKNGKYEIGYGKPPKHTQFKGCGNLKGRPKGSKNVKTELRQELAEKIMVNEGGKTKKVTKQRALIKALVNKGLKGDVRAAEAVLSKSVEFQLFEDMREAAKGLSEADQALIDGFIDAEIARRGKLPEDGNAESNDDSKEGGHE